MKRAAETTAAALDEQRPTKRLRRTPVLPDGAAYWPTFLNQEEANRLFQELLRDSPFRAETVVMYGKEHETKRQSCAYGDDTSAVYKYGGVTRAARAWPPALKAVRDRLATEFHVPADTMPNYALVNLYADGDAGIGWHADKVGDLVPGSTIYSLSLGAERDFQFKPIVGSKDKPTTISLTSGALVTMTLDLQKTHKHCVPVRKGVREARINVTFRRLRPAPASLGA